MSRDFDTLYQEKKNALVSAFREANPEYWAKLQSSPKEIERVRDILKFTDEAIERLENEQTESFKMRVGEEAIKVFEERTNQKLTPKTPGGVINLSSESLIEEAKRRIAMQNQQDAEALRQDGNTAIEITANISQQKKEKLEMSTEEKNHFKADLHKAVDTAQKARVQSRKLFYQERDNLIEEAKAAGSQEPEKDVAQAQARIMNDIDRQEHKAVHEVFENYGWERGKRAVEFSEDDSVQENSPEKNKLVAHVQKFVEGKIEREASDSNAHDDHDHSQEQGPEHDQAH